MSLRLLLRWIPLLCWMSLIFAFSSFQTISTSENGTYDYIVKKVAHILVYAILFFLTWRVIDKKNWQNLLAAMIFCILYAVSDEIHQSFVPGRHPHIKDVGYDFIGILLSLTWLKYVQPKVFRQFFA